MSTSCGGGYCDCGDPEAWSDFVHCAAHSIGNGGGMAAAASEDPVIYGQILVNSYSLRYASL